MSCNCITNDVRGRYEHFLNFLQWKNFFALPTLDAYCTLSLLVVFSRALQKGRTDLRKNEFMICFISIFEHD